MRCKQLVVFLLVAGCSGPGTEYRPSGTPALKLEVRVLSTKPIDGWSPIEPGEAADVDVAVDKMYSSTRIELGNVDVASLSSVTLSRLALPASVKRRTIGQVAWSKQQKLSNLDVAITNTSPAKTFGLTKETGVAVVYADKRLVKFQRAFEPGKLDDAAIQKVIEDLERLARDWLRTGPTRRICYS